MRLTNPAVITMLSVIMIIVDVRAENRETIQNLIAEKGQVSILLGRPVNISEPHGSQWLAALMETVLEYKLAAVNTITLVPGERIRTLIPSHMDYALIPNDDDYLLAGRKTHADYVATQKFEVIRGKTVIYYMEVAATSSQRVVCTIEHEFKLQSLGDKLNAIVWNLLAELELSPPPELTRFFKLPAVGKNSRVLEKLGNYIIRERFSRTVDSILIANDYRTFCENEQSMQLAYYQAGRLFLSLGRHNDAVEALNFLFRSIPEYTPLYVPLLRALRMAGRYKNALQIIEFAQKRSIASPEFNLEKALYYQTTGNIEKAEYVFRQILMSNPEDRNALQFYVRYYEQ
jgi:tetratricopeptide (TPR) repeat protein